jgi:hypothetical protein
LFKIPFHLKASLAFLLVFIMSDQLIPQLQFFRPLRFVLIAFIGILSLQLTRKSSVIIACLPFTLWAAFISYFESPNLTQSLPRAFGFYAMSFCIFNYLRQSFKKNEQLFSEYLLKFLIFILGLSLLLIPLSSYPFLDGRFRGVFGNPNAIGLFCILSYPLIDLLKSRGFKPQFKYEKGFQALTLICILLTRSRTALACLIIYELFKFTQKKTSYFVISLMALVILSLTYTSIDYQALIKDLNLEKTIRLDTLEDASGRKEVWEVAKEEIKKQPWTGKGMLYDGIFINDFKERHHLIGRHWSGIWSSYYSTLLNVGYIGMAFLFFYWFQLYQACYKKKIATAYLIMVFFSGITESWFMASMNAFTPFFLLFFAIQSVPIKQKPTSEVA